jgi:transcriptional pleiotropic regulator of transition state genes
MTIRTVDELGRIVIPSDMRRNLHINTRDEIAITRENDKIIVTKHVPTCVFCGTAENLYKFKKDHLCSACLDELKSVSVSA